MFVWLASHWIDINWWSPFISGRYECKLIRQRDKSVFRQVSNGPIILKALPKIQMASVKTVQCEVGKQVLLQCSVNSPYKVEFKEFPAAGKPETKKHPKANQLLGNVLKLFEIMCILFCFLYLGTSSTITHEYQITNCATPEIEITCQVKDNEDFNKKMKLELSQEGK